jgi:predicted amino acid racemase
MSSPRLTIDLGKLEANARTVTRLCGEHGIAVTGVTKGTCGSPEVARAMLRGGVASIGESRMENIHRLRGGGIDTSFMFLRVPSLSRVEDVVAHTHISLNSENSVITALAEAAYRRGLVHGIIIMVDLGDLREGVWPDDVVPFVKEIIDVEGIRIAGLGTNLTCYGGVIPTEENMQQLVELACEVEKTFDLKLEYLSGGSSSALQLISEGRMPGRINHLRIGEAILLGVETAHRTPWPGTHQDAFVLYSEVIELKSKPSVPIGEVSQDAFGRKPVFEDRGMIDRAILDVGREDVEVEGIRCVDPRVRMLGATSGALVVDVTAAKGGIRVGDSLAFSPNYAALLQAMDSQYVEKRPFTGNDGGPGAGESPDPVRELC